eukprot:1957438-Prymnesium_polylepis.1
MGALQAQGENFANLMGAVQAQVRSMQTQVGDARRTADAAAAAAADATAMMPRLNSVLEGSASATGKALLA